VVKQCGKAVGISLQKHNETYGAGMCEFCTKHGDGKIWYKNARNYANDLMADLERRKYISEFFNSTIKEGIVTIGRLESIYKKRGKLPQKVGESLIEQAKIDHFGQVVTMEDVTEIVKNAATIVRLPCACRWASSKKEDRCCYSVSYSPDYWYEDMDMSYFGMAQSEGLEEVSKEVALKQMKTLESSGAIHTVWTMKTPFIGAICNCTPEECLGLRTLSLDIETMFRGEEVAVVDEAKCTGCGACELSCHFNAISDKAQGDEYKATVSPHQCFGCGLCRNSCPEDAIAMHVRG
jgi:Pyruvate/2-oxoacid:ferredoxin oxidoreductase delta subunit